MNQALAGGLAPYLSLAMKKATEGDPAGKYCGPCVSWGRYRLSTRRLSVRRRSRQLLKCSRNGSCWR